MNSLLGNKNVNILASVLIAGAGVADRIIGLVYCLPMLALIYVSLGGKTNY